MIQNVSATSLQKHPNVPRLDLKKRPEDMLREFHALARHLNENSE